MSPQPWYSLLKSVQYYNQAFSLLRRDNFITKKYSLVKSEYLGRTNMSHPGAKVRSLLPLQLNSHLQYRSSIGLYWPLFMTDVGLLTGSLLEDDDGLVAGGRRAIHVAHELAGGPVNFTARPRVDDVETNRCIWSANDAVDDAGVHRGCGLNDAG